MEDIQSIARKITRTLFFSQVSVSAALIMITTVSALVGAELSGEATWAGVPSAVVLLSTAVGALVWGTHIVGRGGGGSKARTGRRKEVRHGRWPGK